MRPLNSHQEGELKVGSVLWKYLDTLNTKFSISGPTQLHFFILKDFKFSGKLLIRKNKYLWTEPGVLLHLNILSTLV